jgi:hypothetical protein
MSCNSRLCQEFSEPQRFFRFIRTLSLFYVVMICDREKTMSESRAVQFAAIYCRVSTEGMDTGFSIPTRIEAGRELEKREG